ncbi:MAG TPA: ATP synthase F1 subunit epsilon [Acidimicrobiales bacterium]|nr:ATP synthase F1 subunit epsilon [Acidimicrobiales bacterium]
MGTPFHVELVTPERVLFSGEADEVSLRTDVGEIAFLAHHEDFVGAVDISLCTIDELSSSGEEATPRRCAVHGGFVYVSDNAVTILAGVAELGEEIDVERARAALQRAEQEVASGAPAAEGHEAVEGEEGAAALSPTMLALMAPDAPEVALRRAQVRLEAAGAAPAA